MIDAKITVEIDEATKRILDGSAIERATVGTVEKLLDRVEDATLITQYTQTSKPAKPAGSTYIRTFRLQHSSRKKITRRTLPAIEGRWEARTAYASDVIGEASQQDEIHAGRWPSLELAINAVKVNAQSDFDKEIRKEKL